MSLGGRPTKYRPEFCTTIIDHFRAIRAKGLVPTLCGFADTIDVDRTTLENWQRAHPDFDSAVSRALGIQEDALCNHSNTAMAIFLLKNNHGYRDKQELTVDTQGELSEALKRIEARKTDRS